MQLLKYFCHQWFRSPRGDRLLYSVIHNKRPRQIVQIGLGDGQRTATLLRMAARYRPDDGIAFAGIDLFEDRPSQLAGMSCQQAHRMLRPLVERLSLVPGDPFRGLAHCANRLAGTDLVIVSAGHEKAILRQAWFYLPRMLCQDSIVLVEERSRQGLAFRHMDIGELAHLAADVSVERRAAA